MALTKLLSGRSRTYRPGFFARLFPAGKWKLTLDPKLSGHFQLAQDSEVELSCLDVVSISTSKALLWHTVEIRARGRTDTLSALSGDAATQLAADLHAFINTHLFGLIAIEKGRLLEVDGRLREITEGNRQYLAQADLSRAIASVPGAAAAALSHPLLDPSLMPAGLKASLPASFAMITDPRVRHAYNEAFVRSELIKFRPFFDDLDRRSFSDQQREACIRLEDNNLLVASAGSGKSATMVGKVAYVLEKQLYRPDEILLLAFNKNAADELRTRIAAQLQVAEDAALECRVTTFHALGRGIIKEVEGRPPQLANWVDHPAGETKVIEAIIQNLIEGNPEFARMWAELLVVHPKADIPIEVFDGQVDYRRYVSDSLRKGSATIGSLSGVIVKSMQEQKIANWLWLHSVTFEYERQIAVAEDGDAVRHLHPDFYYPQTATVHEHFALNADGSSPFADYTQHAENKRLAYRRNEIDFFETTSAQASNETLLGTLESELARRSIPFKRKSYAEITKALDPVIIKHYHQLISTCLKHIRASHLTLDMLLERAKTLHDKERAKLFARVVLMITQGYSRKLEETKRIDFDSMIADAVRLVETGRYRSPYSLILVDEFQDISEPRANLIKALKLQKAFSKVFAVGDDWQSIYRFAGSDITIFTRFEANFGTSWQGRLEQTYRCNQLIAETAAKFVQRNPEQIKKSVRSTRPAVSRSIRVIPIDDKRDKPDFAEACQRLLERLDAALGGIANRWRDEKRDKLKVLVLWRYNVLDTFEGRPPSFANIEVTGLSFHRSKGLEADYTVLLDISEGNYGVPSRIEGDELLNLVIPRPETFAYAEERRLFYVALTRASRGVYMLTNRRQPSRYIQELCEIAGDEVRFETVEGAELSQCPACLVGQLVERRNKDGSMFRGCNQFPDCKHTEPASVVRRR
ncbi:UvrD-helicase domain-containing protein [Mesorhizobium sp. B2-1-8]|uniref:UvrD-helicase domain-containing protein n=1 Tax=Mesorhizobium sp. B2-1-8 TaxID=2589967 RepID=UPI0022394186|nr:UvrD-helicase domain-containing protein [Mesorhizobium sp. B2-1-8]